MEKTLVEQMTEFLDETIQYYSEDTNRRCVSSFGCFYNPKRAFKQGVSQGCAIGRKMSSSQKRYAEEVGIELLNVKYIPKSLKLFPIGFLKEVQNLHDESDYWNCNKGLTEEGESKIAEIREEFLTNN